VSSADGSGAIVVKLESGGELLLRPLTVRDELSLQRLVREDLSPTQFAVRVLDNQVLDSSPVRPADLDGSALLEAALAWAEQDVSLGALAPDQGRSLEGFREFAENHVEDTLARMRQFSDRLHLDFKRSLAQWEPIGAGLSAAVLRTVDESVSHTQLAFGPARAALADAAEQFAILGRGLSNAMVRSALLAVEEQSRLIRAAATIPARQIDAIVRSLGTSFAIQDLVRTLPSAREIVAAWRGQKATIERGAEILNKQGFSFAETLVGTRLAVSLARVPQRVWGAQTTNRLLAFTKSEPFRLALEEHVGSSEVAKRRWRIIAEALVAHSCRQYVLSVPALFAQVEGLFTDSMIVNGLAEIRNGKVYALDDAGNAKLNKKSKQVRLIGLGSKVQHSPYQNHTVLSEVVGALVESLTHKRDCVLHGSDTSYGTAKLSTQLMLLVHILAKEILAFESGTVDPVERGGHDTDLTFAKRSSSATKPASASSGCATGASKTPPTSPTRTASPPRSSKTSKPRSKNCRPYPTTWPRRLDPVQAETDGCS